jgi:hypothetical protein
VIPVHASYGWVVVGVSATVSSLAWSVRSTFALFYVALLGEFAWSRGEAAIASPAAEAGRYTSEPMMQRRSRPA